jgi:O-methyltransferase domain
VASVNKISADSKLGIDAFMRIYHIGVVWHCLCVITRLGVVDRLASGPLPVGVLADGCGVQAEPLRRVLRLLSDYEVAAFGEENVVALTDFGRLLSKEHPSSIGPIFAAVGLADVAHALEESLRTGEVAAERVLGVPFWQYLAAHADQQALFDECMRIRTNWLAESYIAMLEWPSSGMVVDVGGGIGTMMSAVLRAAPGLRGILIDQEQVLARARVLLADELAAGRCELRSADLFSPAPRGDIYILSSVLHDWSDPDAVRILDAIGKQAPESARLRIFEHVVPADGSPHVSKFNDVAMLLLFGEGRERTEDEFGHLLDQAGWRIEAVIELEGASMIEACRTSSGQPAPGAD